MISGIEFDYVGKTITVEFDGGDVFLVNSDNVAEYLSGAEEDRTLDERIKDIIAIGLEIPV